MVFLIIMEFGEHTWSVLPMESRAGGTGFVKDEFLESSADTKTAEIYFGNGPFHGHVQCIIILLHARIQ